MILSIEKEYSNRKSIKDKYTVRIRLSWIIIDITIVDEKPDVWGMWSEYMQHEQIACRCNI